MLMQSKLSDVDVETTFPKAEIEINSVRAQDNLKGVTALNKQYLTLSGARARARVCVCVCVCVSSTNLKFLKLLS